MPPDDPEDLDPGLARERTMLAWVRTGIAFAAVGAVMLRKQPVVGLIVLAITPVIWVLGRVASQQIGPKPHARQLLLITVMVTLVAALAVVVALVGHAPASLRELLSRMGV